MPPTKLPQITVLPMAEPGQLLLPENVRQLKVKAEIAQHSFTANDEVVLAYLAKGQPSSELKHGCVVKVIQSYALPETDTYMTIFKGLQRCTLSNPATETKDGSPLVMNYDLVEDTGQPSAIEETAIRRIVERHLAKLLRGSFELSTDALRTAAKIDQLSAYIDFLVLASAGTEHTECIPQILAQNHVKKRAQLLIDHLARLTERSTIEKNLRRRIKKQMEKSHYEFHLNEQAKAIQDELEHDGSSSIAELEKRINDSGMHAAAMEKCQADLAKLKKNSPLSPEASVLRGYIETLLELPWKERSVLQEDMRQAAAILDEDHFGLTKVKDRIMEYLAVQRRTQQPQGTVMCFVGPPGVGKTSLGKSIARATGREFVRVSLGGVHEEAAIRGHRKTYVASMPGRILKAMAKVKVKNPVFMLDEFDKIVTGSSYNGDPAAALLEVLDPEQNSTFTDQYVEVEFDLSEVMFITTANTVRYMPDALRDRLEIIRLPGYTDQEKIAIAKQHLIPKQLHEHRLAAKDVRITDAILAEIIRDYTHEAGVRSLERNIAKICRKLVTEGLTKKGKAKKHTVSKARIRELLEVPEYYSTFAMPNRPKVGYVNGLVYGAGVFRMEAIVHRAKSEEVSITGTTEGTKELESLVNVGKSLLIEDMVAAGRTGEFTKEKMLHIHLQDQATLPFGALGLGLFILQASAYGNIPVKPGVAFLGEINLRGDVISSEYYSEYKATVMDAQQKKIKTIVMPQEDALLLEDLPPELTRTINFILVRRVWHALEHAFGPEYKPGPIKKSAPQRGAKKPPAGQVATRH